MLLELRRRKAREKADAAKQNAKAKKTKAEFDKAWSRADIQLTRSAY